MLEVRTPVYEETMLALCGWASDAYDMDMRVALGPVAWGLEDVGGALFNASTALVYVKTDVSVGVVRALRETEYRKALGSSRS